VAHIPFEHSLKVFIGSKPLSAAAFLGEPLPGKTIVRKLFLCIFPNALLYEILATMWSLSSGNNEALGQNPAWSANCSNAQNKVFQHHEESAQRIAYVSTVL
jgi:hypothetical protein